MYTPDLSRKKMWYPPQNLEIREFLIINRPWKPRIFINVSGVLCGASVRNSGALPQSNNSADGGFPGAHPNDILQIGLIRVFRDNQRPFWDSPAWVSEKKNTHNAWWGSRLFCQLRARNEAEAFNPQQSSINYTRK